MNKILIITVVFVCGGLLGGLAIKAMTPNIQSTQDTSKNKTENQNSDWGTFSDTIDWNNSEISFVYPPDYTTNVDKTNSSYKIIIFSSSKDEIPAMTIQIFKTEGDARIIFALWEGIAWEYFDEVVESFEIN